MSPQLTADLDGVLNSLLGLYGNGQPVPGTAATVASSISADISKHVGAKTDAYSGARGMQVAAAEAHASRDSVVHQAVSAAGDGTVNGRGHVSNQIADLQTRMRAIASVGDTRFSGPALLDSAQSTLTNVTKQVNSDVAAAHQQAARIMPASTPQPTRGRVTPVSRGASSRRRRRVRPASARSRSGRPRRPVPSDGTAGGKAVSAASAWLGTPYIWGGGGAGGPSGGGFDCSGLTQYAVAHAPAGPVVVPRTTDEHI
ncbi:peptidase P60 [Nocardia wallacei]|uniref:peptidase P60 n=1 Tax=Nocardia wallacei TaxID=480035 RepID=UPI00313D4D86